MESVYRLDSTIYIGLHVWVYPSVPVNSQPWTARYGDRHDPQPIKRSNERRTTMTATNYDDHKHDGAKKANQHRQRGY